MSGKEFLDIGVLGAGLMGHGIAQVFATAGHQVNLYDHDPQVLNSAVQRIQKNLDTFLRLKMIAPRQAADALEHINLSKSLASLCSGRDLIIEAVGENLDLKRNIFAALEKNVSSRAVLASNTSAISIGKIAEGLSHPERVLGTHFWNPPHIVPCVEVIKAPLTAMEVLDKIHRLLAKVGKRPVKVMKDIPGFLGNRMQHALWREAFKLVEQGIASAEDVDDVVRYGFGLRLAFLGPLHTADLAGLDLTYEVHKDLFPHLDRSTRPSSLLEKKIERGELGVKSGRGFHLWSPAKTREVIESRDEILLKILREILPSGDA